MAVEVFYQSASELATLTNTFSVAGVATDPTTVALTVTAPSGAVTTYTYAASEITRTGTGAYRKDVACTEAGLWQYVWTGTGAVSDAAAGSWLVQSTDLRRYYTTLDLLKDALKITDATRDAALLAALAAAAEGINEHCGRRFWLDGTASARTWRTAGRVVPDDGDGELLLVDDIGTTAGLIVEVGDGSTWTTVTDFFTEPDNALAAGKPITGLRRDCGVWSDQRRVRITARWGWPAVPDVVAQAELIQAARLYRRKDSPEGVMGTAEWGLVRLSRLDPDVQQLLHALVQPGFA